MVDDTQTPPKKAAKKVTKKVTKKTPAKKVRAVGAPLLELIIGDETGRHDNADVPVRWCLNNSLIEDMKKKNIKNPQVLLVTLGEDGREMPGGRTMAPLKELMSIGRFTRPGKNTIFGLVVHNVFGNTKILKRGLTDRSINGRYETILVHDGKLDPSTDVKEMTLATAKRDVTIPEGIFAKQYPESLRWYINLWHRAPLEDDCHQNKRMAIAIPKSIAVLGFITYHFIGRLFIGTLIAGLGWFHAVNWKPIFHPFTNSWTDVIGENAPDMSSNWFAKLFKMEGFGPTQKSSWNDRTGDTLVMMPFAPLWIVIAIWFFWMLDFSFIAGIAAGLLLLAFVAVVIGLIYGVRWTYRNVEWANRFGEPIFNILEKGGNWVWDQLEKFNDWLIDREIERNRLDNLPELICPKNATQKIVADFSQIEMRSLRLWFLRVKNKICKPAAR